jgi:prepilin peptidase CpaA
MPLAVQATFLLTFPLLVIVAGLRDLTSYTIPNWISAALLLLFFPTALVLDVPLNAVGIHSAVGAVALALGVILFALGWIGGGDAKLFAVAGLWLGWPALADFLLVMCVAGGVFVMLLLALRSVHLRGVAERGPPWFGRLATPGGNVPYGVAIAIGALAAFPGSTLTTAFWTFG